MDPVSAFGLATNVISVVEFCIQTLSELNEVRTSDSGVRRTHETLNRTSTDLESVCTRLDACLNSVPGGSVLSPSHAELYDVASKCSKAAQKLRNLLDELKPKESKRDALLKAIKTKWKQREIDEIQSEVNEYRNALGTRILVDLKLSGDEMRRALTEMKSVGDETQAMVRDMQALLLSPTQIQTNQARITCSDEARVLKDALWFPEMYTRQDQIARAHGKTFKWVFEEPDQDDQPCDSFLEWLQNDQSVYWINGKAGSGKSTLMKYIADENEHKAVDSLKVWSGQKQLVLTKFFFWNSGTAIQKSQKGMLRSISHQIIVQSPTSAPTLFPASETVQIASLSGPEGMDRYWTERKLVDALSRLVSVTNSSQCFCFFIDGLDEFGGDHDVLVELAEELAAAPHIKICVASRPLQVFREAFEHGPGLRLQDLTAGDLRTFVDDKLRANARGRKLADQNSGLYKGLIDEFLRKASGVFLWVSLAVKSLIGGLRSRDTMDSLKARLDVLSDDKSELFMGMIASLEPRYQEEAAKIFRSMFAAPEWDRLINTTSPYLSVLDLLFAEDPNVVASALAYPLDEVNWTLLEDR